MPASAVLLIDLENMTGAKARPTLMGANLDALIGQVGLDVPAVAACAGSRINPAGVKVLQERRIRLIKTDESRDAADKALLAEAERLAKDGCSRFVVASSDSRFAVLAGRGTLEIVIWDGQMAAKKYTSRAASVHRVPRPSTSSGTPRPVLPVQAPPVAASPAKPAPPTTAATPRSEPAATPAPMYVRPAYVATAAAGVAAAGILFGAGAVLGAAAIARLLRQSPPV